MPEDLLQELEAPAPVAIPLEQIESQVRDALRAVGQAVEGMQGSARAFENAWRRMVLDVAAGQTLAIQALRPRLLRAFAKRLDLLKLTHRLASWLRNLGRTTIPDPEALLPEIAGLERLKATVFDPWQTVDDLEDLAARDYPLTTADLDQIGPHRRPPASYYADESKPF